MYTSKTYIIMCVLKEALIQCTCVHQSKEINDNQHKSQYSKRVIDTITLSIIHR